MDSRKVKICLLGEAGVGKSSIAHRYVKDTFDPMRDATIGASLLLKSYDHDGRSYKLEIWDTAGQDRFRTLAPMYYRGSNAAILVFDVTLESTFQDIKYWVGELKKHAPSGIVLVIVGNKTDLESKREVESEAAEDYAVRNGALYMETSAKTAKNVTFIFEAITQKLPAEVDGNTGQNHLSLSTVNSSKSDQKTSTCAC